MSQASHIRPKAPSIIVSFQDKNKTKRNEAHGRRLFCFCEEFLVIFYYVQLGDMFHDFGQF